MPARCADCGQFIKAGGTLCARDKAGFWVSPQTSRTSNASYELAAFDRGAALDEMVKTAARKPRWFRRGRS